MKERRFAQYLMKKRHGSSAITSKEDVRRNPDNRIDQDFPGYPHGSAREETINPETRQEKKAAGFGRNARNSSGSTITSTSKDDKE